MPDQDAEYEAMKARLLGSGYRDIPEVKGIQGGTRVHHVGQRYVEAYWDGTATVLAIMEKSPSAWAQDYGRRDIELIVQRDTPLLPGMSLLSGWADYHTVRAEGRPSVGRSCS